MRLKYAATKFLYTINDNALYRKIYKKEIKKRSTLPFTDIKKLSKNINIFSPHTSEYHHPNDYYGHASTLKKYLGYQQNYPFKFTIEHGLIFEKRIFNFERDSPFKTTIVSNEFRRELWKKAGYNSYSIGPYIFYAHSLLSPKQKLAEKRRLGKNLLIFPTHSTPDLTIKYDINEYCKNILKIGKSFTSIRICLYWKDVQNKVDKIYKSFGFECVTAGHVLDSNFLPRLKSIIECSSYTISNDLGTQSAYCLLLKKPHTIIHQKLFFKGRRSEVLSSRIAKENINHKKLLSILSNYQGSYKRNQIIYLNRFFGLDQIKTKRELSKIVNISENYFQHNR